MMRLDAPAAAELAGGKFWTTATITLGGQSHTATLTDGHLIQQADQDIETQLSGLKIPASRGRDLVKDGVVGADGHRLRLTCHCQTRTRVWQWPEGEYLITKATTNGSAISLEAASMRKLVAEHEAAVARGVGKSARISWIVRDLLAEDGIELFLDENIADIQIPAGFTLSTKRGEDLGELLTAWGAYLIPHPGGGMLARAIPSGPIVQPAMRFTSTTNLIDAPLTLSRDDIFNDLIVDVKAAPGVARATQRAGRYGVKTFGWRSKRIDSDAIRSQAQAQLVARAELTKHLTRSVTVPVEALPDWRSQLWDPVSVTSDTISGWGYISGRDMPLTHRGSAVYHVGIEV